MVWRDMALGGWFGGTWFWGEKWLDTYQKKKIRIKKVRSKREKERMKGWIPTKGVKNGIR